MITFIRIPKNASTSLYTFFGDENTIRNEYIDSDNERYMNIFESSHCEIDYAVDILGEEILDNPVLSVVRNPFDRLVSMYFFARKYDLGKIYDIDISTFDDFVEGFYRYKDDKNFFHAIPQCDYIKSECPNLTVIRFESLEDDLTRFIEDNELNFDITKLEKLNSTEHTHYGDYYSDTSKGIVEDMWGMDLDRFSYDYEQKR